MKLLSIVRLYFALAFLSFFFSSAANIFIELRSVALIFRVVVICSGLAVFVISYFAPRPRRNRAGAAFSLFVLFAVTAVFSSAYSVDSLVTLGRSAELLSFCFVVYVISGHLSFDFLEVVWCDITYMLAVLLLLLLALGALVPGFFAGFLSNSNWVPVIARNNISAISSCLALIFLVRFLGTPKLFFFSSLLVFTSLLVLSLSRASLLIFATVFLFVLFARGRFGSIAFISWVTLLSVLPLSLPLIDWFLRGQSTNEILRLSGRIFLWEEALKAIRQEWLLGYGFYAYEEKLSLLAGNVGFRQTTVDNSFLSVAVGVGVVGFAPFLLFSLFVFWRFLMSLSFKRIDTISLECAAVGLFLLLRSPFNPSFLYFGWQLVFVLVGFHLLELRSKFRAH